MSNPNPVTAWKPGQSGNPKGRPPKERALTALLEAAGSKTVLVDGKAVSGKRALAQALWHAALQGAAVLYDAEGTRLEFSPRDWLDIAKFLYAQIDGPPRGELDVTSNGEAVIGTIVVHPPPPPPADAA